MLFRSILVSDLDLIFFCTALDWSQPRDIITSRMSWRCFTISVFLENFVKQREREREIFGVKLTKLSHEICWGEMVFRLLVQII